MRTQDWRSQAGYLLSELCDLLVLDEIRGMQVILERAAEGHRVMQLRDLT